MTSAPNLKFVGNMVKRGLKIEVLLVKYPMSITNFSVVIVGCWVAERHLEMAQPTKNFSVASLTALK